MNVKKFPPLSFKTVKLSEMEKIVLIEFCRRNIVLSEDRKEAYQSLCDNGYIQGPLSTNRGRRLAGSILDIQKITKKAV